MLVVVDCDNYQWVRVLEVVFGVLLQDIEGGIDGFAGGENIIEDDQVRF